MDRGLKQMLWMSWTLRCRTLCLNYAVSNQASQGTLKNYWTNSRDTRWSQNLEPLKKIVQDPQIYSTNDFVRILDTIHEKRPNMELKDMLDILTVLVEIARIDKYKINLMDHEGFQILCEKLKKQIRFMSLSEVMDCIKILMFLNVPASTVLMQNLLQIIRNSLNDLQINQVHLLLSLLKKMETTPLSSALHIALSILLPNIIKEKLNYDDLHELSIALYRIKSEEQKHIIIKICRHIQWVIQENPKIVSIQCLISILCSLCYTPLKNYDSNVLLDTVELTKQTLLKRTYRFTTADIEECLRAIAYSVRNGNKNVYDSMFVTTLLHAALSRKPDINKGCKILNHLNSIHYIYVPFLEDILNRTLPEDISNSKLNIILHACCISGYKSLPWTSIEKNILQLTLESDATYNNLLKCTLYLATLDKYYPDMLSIVFLRTNIHELTLMKHNYMNLLYLYQGVKTLYSEYEGPWPSEEVLAYIFDKIYPNKNSILKGQLEIAMGGPQYVLTNLKTRIGHIIDCAIVMRKGGYPIAFNTNNSEVLANYSNYVEELQFPPESYVILILEFPHTAYSINTSRLLDVKRLQLKSLEKWTGHKCIDINLKIWENLPKHEKISHIMEKIRNECNDIIPNL